MFLHQWMKLHSSVRTVVTMKKQNVQNWVTSLHQKMMIHHQEQRQRQIKLPSLPSSLLSQELLSSSSNTDNTVSVVDSREKRGILLLNRRHNPFGNVVNTIWTHMLQTSRPFYLLQQHPIVQNVIGQLRRPLVFVQPKLPDNIKDATIRTIQHAVVLYPME